MSRERRMERTTPVWEAPADLVELMGDVSGNELNGWGEPEVRQPSLVMWANPAKLAHGAVQQRMTAEFIEHPELRTVLRTDDRHTPVPIADEPHQASADQWMSDIRTFATSAAGHGVELVGAAVPRPEWFFEGRQSKMPFVVMLGIAMDLSLIHI